MRRCSEPAGSGFAVVALKAVPHDPAREEGTREITEVWEGEGTQGINRVHGLHADDLEKVGAMHASPVRPALTPASDTLRLARPREHCPHLFLYPQWVSSAKTTPQRLVRTVSRGARQDPQRREGGAMCGLQARHGLTGKTGAPWYGRPFLMPPASRARASIVHICNFIRSGFPARKRPSKGWREPFLKVLAKTRNAEKAALSVGIRHNRA